MSSSNIQPKSKNQHTHTHTHTNTHTHSDSRTIKVDPLGWIVELLMDRRTK